MPEGMVVWFIPDLDIKAGRHSIRIYVRDESVQKFIITMLV